MADFVAVIRRAVDGLANNTPELREKVYEKARGAVQRQLENMKPRPPEDMLRRQLDKLEAAIQEVESEHAEALPPLEEETPEIEAVAPVEPVSVEAAPAEPVPVEEPVAEPQPVSAYRSEFEDDADEMPYPGDEAPAAPRRPEVIEEPVVEPEPEAYDEPYEAPAAESGWQEPAEAEAQPVAEDAPVYAEEEAEPEPAPVYAEPEEASFEEFVEPAPLSEPEPVAEYAPEPEEFAAAEPVAEQPVEEEPVASSYPAYGTLQEEEEYEQTVSYVDEPVVEHAPETEEFAGTEPVADAPVEDVPFEEEPVAVSAAGLPSADWAWPGHDEPVSEEPAAAEAVEPMPPVDEERPADIAPEEPENEFAHYFESIQPPSVSGAADAALLPVEPVAAEVASPAPASENGFGAAGFAAGTRAPEPPKAGAAKESDPWSDLEELIGLDKSPAKAGGSGGPAPEAVGEAIPQSPAKAYRATPKPKRNYAIIGLGILGLLLVAGGGYALWTNKDAMTGAISDLIEPTPSVTPSTDANGANGDTSGAGNGASGTANGAVTDDGTVNGTKFTQRLLPDGSEVDEGPGGVQLSDTGGQSVAEQTEASGETVQGDAAMTPPAGGTTATTSGDTVALPGEKMFLYEERLGQTVPTAIEGSIAWSLQEEQNENGQPEPTIQGRLNIPERGLTALITMKRNTDVSLPASHLIEIVFAVPPDFEGGAIDGVQRIAMKTTEQDRGNPLIAVPAKITDDFHMIALNDFPDAQATNIELLRSRNWIDIPVSYRNGRRALLTLQKGEEGTRVFNTAIREWAARGEAGQTGQ